MRITIKVEGVRAEGKTWVIDKLRQRLEKEFKVRTISFDEGFAAETVIYEVERK